MRNLDVINPALLRPSRFASLSAGTLLALAIITVPLAWGAVPEIPLRENPIVIFIALILTMSIIFTLISAIFQLDGKLSTTGSHC